MPDFAVVTAFKATDKISPAFKRMGANADAFGAKGSGAMGKVNRAASGLMGTMRMLLPVFGVAVIAQYANKAIELASSLTEVQNVVDTTFQDSAETINKWSKTALKSYGLSELQAKQFTGSLGAMMKSSGLAGDEIVKMSTDLTGLAGDFASFYNLPIEQAFEKIRSGISGETEPLKQLGINMSVANMEAFALSQGITKAWRSMTQAEQTTLRYNYLMKVSADAQGDFNKTLATSYANQKRVLSTQFDQFLANVAKTALPSLVSLFSKLNVVMENMPAQTIAKGLGIILKIVPWLVGAFLAWKAATWGVIIAQKIMIGIGWIKYLIQMLPVMSAVIAKHGLYNFLLGGTAAAQTALAVKTKLVTAAQWLWNAAMSANPIGLVIVAVAALTFAIYKLYKNWNSIKESLKDTAWGKPILAIMDFIESKIKSVSSAMQMLKSVFSGDLSSATNAVLKMHGMESLKPPNKATEKSRQIDFQGNIDVNAPAGTKVSSKTRGAPPVKMNLAGAN